MSSICINRNLEMGISVEGRKRQKCPLCYGSQLLKLVVPEWKGSKKEETWQELTLDTYFLCFRHCSNHCARLQILSVLAWGRQLSSFCRWRNQCLEPFLLSAFNSVWKSFARPTGVAANRERIGEVGLHPDILSDQLGGQNSICQAPWVHVNADIWGVLLWLEYCCWII